MIKIEQVTIQIYNFTELNDKVKSKVLGRYRETNIDDDWYCPVLEGITEDIKEQLNLDIDTKNIYFEIYTRGSYISIPSKVVLNQLMVKYPQLNSLDLPEKVGLYTHYLGGGINSGLRIGEFNIEFAEIEEDIILIKETIKYYIEQDLSKLVEILKKGFKSLYDDYDYLISDEGIIETFEANDYKFLEDGTVYR